MKAEDIKKGLEKDLHNDELKVSEIIINNQQIVESFVEQRVKEDSCGFIDWVNIHTHFYKPVHSKLWYDRQKHYGDKGFTTPQLFNLYLKQKKG